MLDFWVLWMNARNIKYIKKFNPKKSIRLANNKIKTKKFLSERWIPMAKNYWVIKDREELMKFDFSKLPNKEFVVKPNKGSRWRGIHIVKILEETKMNEKKHESVQKNENFLDKIFNKTWISDYKYHPHLFKSRWEIKTDLEFKRILLDNIEWKNSMTAWRDKIMIEEKLIPSNKFKTFCEYGLADIRVITFNLVPVLAMIRIPTEQSGGKANLDKGAIAVWVNIATGEVYSKSKKDVKKHFPNTYKEILNATVEFWDDVLLLSSQTQFFVNLWYLALDWVISSDWPKLLEMNGRWGTKIQNTTWVKLHNILHKIEWLNVKTPEKWVEICKSLFSTKTHDLSKSKVLFLSQEWEITIEKEKIESLNIKVSLAKTSNYVWKDIFEKLSNSNSKTIDIQVLESNAILKWLKVELDETLDKCVVVLGTDTTKDFFVKPVNKFEPKINIFSEWSLLAEDEDLLHEVDDKIHKAGKQLILNAILKPTNYLEELDTFLMNNGKYNPVFKYRFPSDEKLDWLEKELLDIKNILSSKDLKSPVKKLWDEKADELLYRICLIRAYKKQNFKKILEYNTKLFGDFDKKLLEESREKSFEESEFDENLLWDILSTTQIRNLTEEYVLDKGFESVQIIVSPTNLSRMSVVKSKKPKIKIKSGIEIREKALKGVFAHEVDIHLTRLINWQKTGWHIFADGTGFYLKDEEGLAINNAIKAMPKEHNNKNMYTNYFLLVEAQKHDFVKMFELSKFLFPSKNLDRIFSSVFRLKKWITNTSKIHKWAIFMKDKVYLDGYTKCKDIDIKSNNIKLGKIKIDDSI